MIDIKQLEIETEKYGGEYGLSHSKRIVKLVEQIGATIKYDKETILIAALLHDWGGYSAWKVDGVDHAIRSTTVAEEYLKDKVDNQELLKNVLECIMNHHNGNNEKSVEAKLFSDADGLDFLGVVGILRDFSVKDREMRKSTMSSKNRIEKIPPILFFDSSREIAKRKIEEMNRVFEILEKESFGLY